MIDILEITLLGPPFFTDGEPTLEPTEVNRFDAPGRFGSSGTFRFGVDSPNGRFNISGTFRFE